MSKDQDKVFYQILSSPNKIDYINGDTGAGKTYLLQNLKSVIESSGKTLYAYAPTSIAGRKVLREEVTEQADTVQMLLINQQEQAKLNHQSVVFIDEAGLLSYQDINKLLKLQEQKDFKLILVGDTKQHNSVLRGDGLRIIETKTKLKPFRLTTNRRQASNLEYKNAIDLLAGKQTKEALKAFDNMGAIKEEKNSTKRYNKIADDFVKFLIVNEQQKNAQLLTLTEPNNNLPTIQSKELKTIDNKPRLSNQRTLTTHSTKDVLVVTPTHAESEIITNRIRKRLIKHNLIGKENIKVKTLIDRGYTQAQKQNKLIYENRDVLVATQNTKDLKIGKEYQVKIDKDYTPTIKVQSKDDKGKQIQKIIELPYQDSDKFTVNRIKEIELSKGDTINLTANSLSTTNTRLLKGARHQIKSITTDPDTKQPIIKLDNNQILQPDYKNLRHGYTSTSYSSQGLTVKHLIVAQAEVSLPATSFEQAYVSLSRGKTSVSLYTDNKQSLEKAMSVRKNREIVVGFKF
jgi:ATP-dependent exoDNAse (exonuclease V) alpha subunit